MIVFELKSILSTNTHETAVLLFKTLTRAQYPKHNVLIKYIKK